MSKSSKPSSNVPKHNRFTSYVSSRLGDCDDTDYHLKAVTLRLPVSSIAMIDLLTKKLSTSRQEILREIVSTGLTELSESYHEQSGDTDFFAEYQELALDYLEQISSS